MTLQEPPEPTITSDNALKCMECGEVFGPYQRADQAQGSYELHWRDLHAEKRPYNVRAAAFSGGYVRPDDSPAYRAAMRDAGRGGLLR